MAGKKCLIFVKVQTKQNYTRKNLYESKYNTSVVEKFEKLNMPFAHHVQTLIHALFSLYIQRENGLDFVSF